MRELKRYMNRIIFTPMICEKSLPMGLDLIPIYDATGISLVEILFTGC